MTKEEIEGVKIKMKAYIDFHGGDLLDIADIDSCQTEAELCNIINSHRSFLEIVHTDALSHLDRFERELGISEWN